MAAAVAAVAGRAAAAGLPTAEKAAEEAAEDSAEEAAAGAGLGRLDDNEEAEESFCARPARKPPAQLAPGKLGRVLPPGPL